MLRVEVLVSPPQKMNLLHLTRACLCSVVLPVSMFAATPEAKPPTEVVGVVETLNDVVNAPYRVTKTVDGDSTSSVRSVTFVVPTGKRLVVETITVLVKAVVGERAVGFIQTPGSDGNPMIAHIALPSQGTFGEGTALEHFVGNQPMKIRVDGGSSIVVEVRRLQPGKVSPEPFVVQATLCGFLVDIAP
jgi:hypothetical protein